MTGRAITRWAALLAGILAAASLAAQQQDPQAPLQAPSGPAQGLERGSVISPILTINSDRLYFESAYGRRVAAEIEELTSALEAENRRVEAELEAEERALTDRRSELEPESFRDLADAFDVKVQQTRTEQDAKLRALEQRQVREREAFLVAAAPALEQLMRESGAAVVLERRLVWLSVTAVEITDEAIAILDDQLGPGTRLVPDDPVEDAPAPGEEPPATDP
jgi:Skp family chaperone for outer membrane proteins